MAEAGPLTGAAGRNDPRPPGPAGRGRWGGSGASGRSGAGGTSGGDGPRGAWDPVLANRWALLLVAPLLVALLGFVVYPLVKLAIESFTTGEGARNYLDVVESSAGLRALVTTLLASAAVSVVAVAAGGTLAWYIRTTRRAWLRALLWLAVFVPFWMGTVVKNYSFVILFSAEGPLNRFLGLFGIAPLSLLYTDKAVGIGMVYTMIPYAALSLYGVFLTIDEALLDAARSLGASRLRTVRTVVLPLALPGIVASAALVFAISLGFYVTPVLLGGAQAPFIASYIQDYIFLFFNFPLAAAASVILLVVALVTLALALLLVGRERLTRAAG